MGETGFPPCSAPRVGLEPPCKYGLFPVAEVAPGSAPCAHVRLMPASLRVVELGLVDEDVRVGVRGHGQVALADELARSAPTGTPRRCSSEIRRWRRSCGRPQRDPGGPARLRDRRCGARRRRSRRTGARRGRGPRAAPSVASSASASAGCSSTQNALPRLRRRRAQPDAPPRLVVVADERQVDRSRRGRRTSRARAAAAGASTGAAGRPPRRASARRRVDLLGLLARQLDRRSRAGFGVTPAWSSTIARGAERLADRLARRRRPRAAARRRRRSPAR